MVVVVPDDSGPMTVDRLPTVLADRRGRRDDAAALAQQINGERLRRVELAVERDALARAFEGAAATAIAAPASDDVHALARRVDALQDTLGELATAMRMRLRDETAARWVAESELRVERAHVGQLRSDLADLGRLDGSPAEALRAAVREDDTDEDAPSPALTLASTDVTATIANLSRAADRLRERVGNHTVEPHTGPEDDVPADEAAPITPIPVERLVELVPRIALDKTSTFWLTNAIARLDANDRAEAARAVLTLLPLQGAAVRRGLAYDLAIEGAATRRVVLSQRMLACEVRHPLDELPPAPLTIRGTPANVAPLVAGGARRGVTLEVEGRQRLVRRLFRARRRPISLRDAVRAGARFEPDLVLALLCAAVDPSWTEGHTVNVAFAVEHDDAQSWTVTGGGGEALTVTAGQDGAAGARVFAPSSAGLVAYLLRDAPPAEGPIAAGGDTGEVAAVARWFDRVQGYTTF